MFVRRPKYRGVLDLSEKHERLLRVHYAKYACRRRIRYFSFSRRSAAELTAKQRIEATHTMLAYDRCCCCCCSLQPGCAERVNCVCCRPQFRGQFADLLPVNYQLTQGQSISMTLSYHCVLHGSICVCFRYRYSDTLILWFRSSTFHEILSVRVVHSIAADLSPRIRSRSATPLLASEILWRSH